MEGWLESLVHNINTKTISLKFGRLKELMCLSNKWKKKKILVSNKVFFFGNSHSPMLIDILNSKHVQQYHRTKTFLKGRRDQRNYNFYYFVTFFGGTDGNSSEVDRTFFFAIIENGLMTFVWILSSLMCNELVTTTKIKSKRR